MNDFQTSLFDELMQLTTAYKAFYFKDHSRDNITYRVFNYRLVIYKEFLQPSALECRGTTFEINSDGDPISLVSFPFPKFFNLFENESTINVDLSTVVEVLNKVDGSMITTYLCDERLCLKTKGSLDSEQACASEIWLNEAQNIHFLREIKTLESMGYTVIMEWCGPKNKIILNYDSPHLQVLGIRNRADGSFMNHDDVDSSTFPEILNKWVDVIQVNDIDGFVNTIVDQTGIEGVVIRLNDNRRIKVKCNWYVSLHRAMECLNNMARLYVATIDGLTDDMLSLFVNDIDSTNLIIEMQEFVANIYSILNSITARFYEDNKNKERKEYAILAKNTLMPHEFHIVMAMFNKKDYDIKEIMLKNWEIFQKTCHLVDKS